MRGKDVNITKPNEVLSGSTTAYRFCLIADEIKTN